MELGERELELSDAFLWKSGGTGTRAEQERGSERCVGWIKGGLSANVTLTLYQIISRLARPTD